MLQALSEILEFDYKDIDITCPKCKATFKAGEMLVKTEMLKRPGVGIGLYCPKRCQADERHELPIKWHMSGYYSHCPDCNKVNRGIFGGTVK